MSDNELKWWQKYLVIIILIFIGLCLAYLFQDAWTFSIFIMGMILVLAVGITHAIIIYYANKSEDDDDEVDVEEN